MAYVDHAFSISDEDIMMETSYTVNNWPPIKEIGLAITLLVFGTVEIILGIFMACNKIGGDRAHSTESEEPRPGFARNPRIGYGSGSSGNPGVFPQGTQAGSPEEPRLGSEPPENQLDALPTQGTCA